MKVAVVGAGIGGLTLGLALLLGLLAGCGSQTSDDDRAEPTPADQAPTAVPAAAGPVTTRVPVLVLEQGETTVTCLAGAAESAPPQCEGQPLSGWSWEEHPEHQTQAGTRGGDFGLTGTWDGETLEVTDAVPRDEYDGEAESEESPGTTCPEPDGGWEVVDPSKTSSAALDETLRRAGQLPGYAEAWLDPGGVTDPAEQILNVRVTDDLEGAEEALRETWGGRLCVREAVYDEAELVELTTELQRLPGVVDTSAWGDVVKLTVLHDDGTIQNWVDGTYGQGRVEVESMLVPVE